MKSYQEDIKEMFDNFVVRNEVVLRFLHKNGICRYVELKINKEEPLYNLFDGKNNPSIEKEENGNLIVTCSIGISKNGYVRLNYLRDNFCIFAKIKATKELKHGRVLVNPVIMWIPSRWTEKMRPYEDFIIKMLNYY